MESGNPGRGLYLPKALGLVFGRRSYLYSFLVLSISISSLYTVLLPSLPLGSLNFQVVRFVTPLQLAFAVVFGILLSLVVMVNIYSVRLRVKGTKAITIGSILAGAVNGLCCTPVIPSLIAVLGASSTVVFQYSPPIQAFFERDYPYFYLLSALLLLLSLQRSSKNIVCCRRTVGGG
jgi:hypothetical protein